MVPSKYKIKNYVEDILLWCECADNKNSAFYYFPFTKNDIIDNMEFIKISFEKDINPIVLLSKMMDFKKEKGNG